MSRQTWLFWLLAALFVIGSLIGGGRTSPVMPMIVELVACLLGTAALAGALAGEKPREAWPALVLLAFIVALPVIQIIPLPAAWSASLHGREVPEAVRRLVGAGARFQPLSLDPEQTRQAALALIVPAATFLATLQLTAATRQRFQSVVVGVALLSALLGILQVGGGLDLGLYAQTHRGAPIGFFANRNHEADLLLIAIPLSARLVQLWPRPRPTQAWLLLALGSVFALSVVSTQSRTGIALLPLALAGALAVWRSPVRDGGGMSWLGLMPVFGLSLALLAALTLTPVGGQAFHRFSVAGDDVRPQIWQSSWAAIKGFWPAGSGVGTFPPAYDMFEDLNMVGPQWVNHAHSDYLELLLVAGLPGLILLMAFAGVVTAALLRSLPPGLRAERHAALATIGILAMHSVTDYPLRTFGLMTVFAFACASLYPSPKMRNRPGFGERRSSRPPVAAGASLRGLAVPDSIPAAPVSVRGSTGGTHCAGRGADAR